MDLFLVACQGIGLALAAGALAGATGRRDGIGTALACVAALAGAILFGLSLAAEDHPAWPGWPIGAALAWFAFVVTREFAAGAAARAEGGGFVGVVVALAALALAGLSLLIAPISIVALLGLLWLHLGQRRRADSKHAGLRSLR